LVKQLSAVDKDEHPVAFDAGGLGYVAETNGLAATGREYG
jgi:hypothetical protein